MQTEDYQSLYELEETFWWFVGMRGITAALLDPLFQGHACDAILDAGCGTGVNLEWLARYARPGGQVIGIDLVATAVQFSRQRGAQRLAQASVIRLPFANESFDLITSFDVLVQVCGAGADEEAIREMFRCLRPGGIAFVRVAAFEWMRSGHDAAINTQRRYSLPQVRAALERAGGEIVRATYANSLLFPAAAVYRLLLKKLGLANTGSDVQPLPPHLQWLGRRLAAALLWEADKLRDTNFRLPVGLSAICIARKPAR